MDIQRRINAFVQLGAFLRKIEVKNNDPFILKLSEVIQQAYYHNNWFTEKNVSKALSAIGENLTMENMTNWLSRYPMLEKKQSVPKKIGVIMAGNIPLVGFHDFLCVLLSGNLLYAKTSSQDHLLMTYLAEVLIAIEPEFQHLIKVINVNTKLQDVNAVIATGSNNTSRYFEYYFGKYPHIFRKNRNSVAVIEGNESKEELKELGNDIFQYFGLGCRNVSKLFIPKGFDLNKLFEAIFDFKYVIEHKKYANNYDYNKVIYLMNEVPLLENGFVLLKEDSAYASPVAVVFYEYYENVADVVERLKKDKEQIQCIVSKHEKLPQAIAPGKSQSPMLWDYADGVDTLNFLLHLN